VTDALTDGQKCHMKIMLAHTDTRQKLWTNIWTQLVILVRQKM